MTQYLTPAQARETMPCPFARTFAEKKGPNCMADHCPMWRFKPANVASPEYTNAIRKEVDRLMEETGKTNKQSFFKTASMNVIRNPEEHGLSPHQGVGWCGLGGKPEF